MDRKIILQNAILKTQGLSFNGVDRNVVKSVFGVIQNALQAADISPPESKDNLYYEREILKRLLNIQKPDNYRLMGVQLKTLKFAIQVLYCDKKIIFPIDIFDKYTPQDLLGYTEVCRRIYLTKEGGMGKTAPNKTASLYKNEIIKNQWSFEGMKRLEIQTAINNGDRDCADYVVTHEKECRDRGLFKQAKKILNG